MLKIGSFVLHRTRRFERDSEPSLPLIGCIVKDDVFYWQVEWCDNTKTFEHKDDVMEA